MTGDQGGYTRIAATGSIFATRRAGIESRSALTALEKGEDDSSLAVRRAVRWAIRQIDNDRR